MSRIIRGAKIDQQPVQIKIDIPYRSAAAPVEEAPETPNDIVPAAEIPETPAIDVTAYIAQAEAEAQSIIAAAEAQAQQMIAEAQQAAAQLKDAAETQGQAQGYQQGVEQGNNAVAALLAQAEQIVAHAKQEREEIIEKSEREILDLAISIATKVVHTEITLNSDIVVAVVKEAIQKAKDQEQVIVRINPADFEKVAGEKQTLQAILRREMGMEIRGDIGVEIGGCVIETGYGAIDARIDTQLETIKNALLGVVKHA